MHKADLDRDGRITEADYILFKLQQMQKVDCDVLDELIEEGYLDPAVKADMPTYELTGARLVWEEGQLGTCVTSDNQLDDD